MAGQSGQCKSGSRLEANEEAGSYPPDARSFGPSIAVRHDLGLIVLNDGLCDLLSERTLSVAVEEYFWGWNARSGLVGTQFADVPEGTTWASFSRPVEWLFRTKTVWIEINTGAGFCETHVRIRST